MICYSNPGSHPFISKGERDYLQTELGQLKRNDNLPPTPWVSILTSVPMIALVFAQVKEEDEKQHIFKQTPIKIEYFFF